MIRLIALAGTGVSLGGRPVLRSMDFTLQPGEVVGIAGPNGSGKTTLIRTLATLIAPSEGTASVLGVDLAGGDVRSIRPRIGMIGHRPALIQELTLAENLRHLSRLGGIDETRVGRALGVVGLGAVGDRRAHASSFGMQRRVEVAHLLLRRPELVLLDEALSGLDDTAQELIGALVSTTTERGGGVVTVSHDRDHLGAICHRILDLAAGRLEPAS